MITIFYSLIASCDLDVRSLSEDLWLVGLARESALPSLTDLNET